jgi:hypothetical protein
MPVFPFLEGGDKPGFNPPRSSRTLGMSAILCKRLAG